MEQAVDVIAALHERRAVVDIIDGQFVQSLAVSPWRSSPPVAPVRLFWVRPA
jgi:hypothetical protein